MSIEMSGAERRERIRLLVEGLGHVSIGDLVRSFVVPESTIREDLELLQRSGILKVVADGVTVDAADGEPPFDTRMLEHRVRKEAIARTIIGLLTPGQRCFVDAGTTTAFLAMELARLRDLTVITNSLVVARELRSRGSDAKLFVLSGRLHEDVPGTCGTLTLREIEQHTAEIAIISPTALSAEMGVAYYSGEEAEVAKAMIERSERIFVAADSSKLGNTSRFAACGCDKVDVLVTDSEADQRAIAQLTETGIKATVIAPTP